jgi:hypothetical protein
LGDGTKLTPSMNGPKYVSFRDDVMLIAPNVAPW